MINFLGFLCMLIGEVFWIPRTDQKIEHSTGFFFFPLSFFLKKKAPYISVGSRLLLFTHKLIKSTFFLLKTKFACNRNKFNLIQFMYIVGCFWTVNGRRPFGIIKNIDCCHSLFSVFTLEQIYVSPFFLASFSKYVTLS